MCIYEGHTDICKWPFATGAQLCFPSRWHLLHYTLLGLLLRLLRPTLHFLPSEDYRRQLLRFMFGHSLDFYYVLFQEFKGKRICMCRCFHTPSEWVCFNAPRRRFMNSQEPNEQHFTERCFLIMCLDDGGGGDVIGMSREVVHHHVACAKIINMWCPLLFYSAIDREMWLCLVREVWSPYKHLRRQIKEKGAAQSTLSKQFIYGCREKWLVGEKKNIN